MSRKITKYPTDLLVRSLRIAARMRNELRAAGLTDNGGAIHSAERIVNMLSPQLRYPELGHLNSYRHYHSAEFSEEAWKRHQAGDPIYIEHVAPLRALTVGAIDRIDAGDTDEALLRYLQDTYRLVLLSPDETRELNRINRSRIEPERIAHLKVLTRPTSKGQA